MWHSDRALPIVTAGGGTSRNLPTQSGSVARSLLENVNRFFGIVDQIAASLAAGDISADELERARRPIVDQIRNDVEDNQYWLGVAVTAQSDPAVLQRHRTRAADYAGVTLADVRMAARRYLVADRAYRIAILPGPAP
jgi:zinc protease